MSAGVLTTTESWGGSGGRSGSGESGERGGGRFEEEDEGSNILVILLSVAGSIVALAAILSFFSYRYSHSGSQAAFVESFTGQMLRRLAP